MTLFINMTSKIKFWPSILKTICIIHVYFKLHVRYVEDFLVYTRAFYTKNP